MFGALRPKKSLTYTKMGEIKMNEYKVLTGLKKAAFAKWRKIDKRIKRVEGRLTEQEIADEYQAWKEYSWLLEECRTYYTSGVKGFKRL
jgi:hypothetical protein